MTHIDSQCSLGALTSFILTAISQDPIKTNVWFRSEFRKLGTAQLMNPRPHDLQVFLFFLDPQEILKALSLSLSLFNCTCRVVRDFVHWFRRAPSTFPLLFGIKYPNQLSAPLPVSISQLLMVLLLWSKILSYHIIFNSIGLLALIIVD